MWHTFEALTSSYMYVCVHANSTCKYWSPHNQKWVNACLRQQCVFLMTGHQVGGVLGEHWWYCRHLWQRWSHVLQVNSLPSKSALTLFVWNWLPIICSADHSTVLFIVIVCWLLASLMLRPTVASSTWDKDRLIEQKKQIGPSWPGWSSSAGTVPAKEDLWGWDVLIFVTILLWIARFVYLCFILLLSQFCLFATYFLG